MMKELVDQIVDITGPGVVTVNCAVDRRVADELALALEERGFHVAVIELRRDTELLEEFLIDQLDDGFKFPEYFGQNWNAVDECIADLSWLPASGYCCVLLNASVLFEREVRVGELFVSVMLAAAESWREEGKRFCLVQAP